MKYYEEPAKKLPVREFDVVIAGGGTAGVVAAIASARQGAKTALIESRFSMSFPCICNINRLVQVETSNVPNWLLLQ